MSSNVKVIHPAGIIDGTAGDQLRRDVSQLIDQGADIILLDLEKVTFMDSSGLGKLVITLKSVKAAGKKLFICSVNEQVRMLFELTSMNRIFEVFANQAEFNQVILSKS